MSGVLKEQSSIKRYWLEPDSASVSPVSLSVTHLSGEVIETVRYSPRAGLEVIANLHRRHGVMVDFGREVGGFPRIVFGTGRCGKVGVQAFESTRHLVNPLGAEAVSLLEPPVYHDHLKGRGETELRLPHCGGFRYLWLYPEHPGRVTVREVSVDYTPHRPGGPDDCGYFLCSDERLNRIWFAGLHTMEMCTVSPARGGIDGRHPIGRGDWVLVDGAKRDRLIWTGDLGPMGAGTYVGTGNGAAVRDSLSSLAYFQMKNGYIPACSPGPLPGRVASGFFGDYTAWWVVCLYQYYLHTGDGETAREYFPQVKRALSYMRSQCKGGLFRQNPRNMFEWCFTVVRRGRPSYTNIMYYWALNSASHLAHEIGEESVSAGYVSRAFRLGEGIERALFDEERGVYVDTSSDRERVPQDANSLAIVSGLIYDPGTAAVALDYLKDTMWEEWGSANVDIPYYRFTPGIGPHNRRVVPFMNNYEALARFAAGDDDGALELIRRCWGGMVDQEPNTTFWEWKGPDGGVDGRFASLCHGWSAGATPLLSKYVLGIRPSEPGYRGFKVDPRLGDLEWAEGRVPVPGGFIEARVEKGAGKLNITVDMPAGHIIEGTQGRVIELAPKKAPKKKLR
jgi:hypothetical protein